MKYILSQINEDGTLKGATTEPGHACAWVAMALRATRNEKYAPLIAQCSVASVKPGRQPRDNEPLELAIVIKQVECLRSCILMLRDHGIEQKKAPTQTVGGKPIITGEPMNVGDLLKVQQKDGSFDADVRKTALALETLNDCYKSLK